MKKCCLLLVLVLLTGVSNAQSRRAQRAKQDSIKAFVAEAEGAKEAGDLKRAEELFTKALRIERVNDVFHQRADVRLTLGDTMGYCRDMRSCMTQVKGSATQFYSSTCYPKDSVDFPYSGLSATRYPNIVRVRRTYNRADGSIEHELVRSDGQVKTSIVTVNGDTLFTRCEENAEFVGGEYALFSYLGKSIRYPVGARDAGVQGTVFLEFIIGPDGALGNSRVITGPHWLLDEEALRVVRSMPPWTPARYMNEPVRSLFRLPVRFTIR